MLFASIAAPSSAWPSVAMEQSTRGERVNIIAWDMGPMKTSGDKFLINRNQVVIVSFVFHKNEDLNLIIKLC